MKKQERESTVHSFDIGDEVRFVPMHAEGNMQHPDCENGRVTSKNERYVFVSFNNFGPQACSPSQLVRMRWGWPEEVSK